MTLFLLCDFCKESFVVVVVVVKVKNNSALIREGFLFGGCF